MGIWTTILRVRREKQRRLAAPVRGTYARRSAITANMGQKLHAARRRALPGLQIRWPRSDKLRYFRFRIWKCPQRISLVMRGKLAGHGVSIGARPETEARGRNGQSIQHKMAGLSP